MNREPKIIRPRRVSFPWFSALAALLLAIGFLLASHPELLTPYGLNLEASAFYPLMQQLEVKVGALIGFCLLLLLDIYRHDRARHAFDRDIKRMSAEITQLWQSKKQLQLKAHTYAGHADKLKLFISEKLLEYIEYDEKFLHFKSIAAEVRHNGVICFDKVQTALQGALADPESLNYATRAQYRDAQTAMRYLWDLLDLSTTDNIALHIGNQLCECEEHYYQLLLNDSESEALPHRPDYSPRRAALRALAPLLQNSPSELEELDTTQPERIALEDDAQFRAYLDPTDTLLGNENHFVLLLENLLKNAQFFTRKKPKQKHHRVALTLSQQQGYIHLAVYNRGPRIEPAKMDQIFQLGYSTRRAREHHGKGLGLFFVQEIVKGYEGQISVQNVENEPAFYSLRTALANGEVVTQVVRVTLGPEGEPRCERAEPASADDNTRTDDSGTEAQLEWDFDSPITRVEITPAHSQVTQGLDCDPKGPRETVLDPDNPATPRWALEIQPRRKGGKLTFIPLDVGGVCFDVTLPTADARLDSDEQDLDALAPRVEDLNRPFEGLEEYRNG
ncbi:sensor histidine kinase [Marinimicrobium sp. C2-29]|uniref:sensor histidine kinase n=1 Tax=Marinimicrobium sp. C2-29 TaxID=3139825 RepID=UPI00313884C7